MFDVYIDDISVIIGIHFLRLLSAKTKENKKIKTLEVLKVLVNPKCFLFIASYLKGSASIYSNAIFSSYSTFYARCDIFEIFWHCGF